jgi:hypothetical protein
VPWSSVRPLLVSRTDAEEMPRLPGEVSEIEGQDSDQEHFHIVDQLLVPKDVPAEMIPGIATSVALVRSPETLSDVSLPHVDWS